MATEWPSWGAKQYGSWHPTWHPPTNFFHDTEEEARASLVKTYGKGSGHRVVRVDLLPEPEQSDE